MTRAQSFVAVALLVGCGPAVRTIVPTEAAAPAEPATVASTLEPPPIETTIRDPAPVAGPVVLQPVTGETRFGSWENELLRGRWTDAAGGRSLDASGRFLLFTEPRELGILDLDTGRVRGRVDFHGVERRSTAFGPDGDYAIVFGRGSASVWDLAHDVVTRVRARGELQVDERARRIVDVGDGQVSLHGLGGELLAGPLETRVRASPGPREVFQIGLSGARSRWVLMDDHTLEVRDASTLELIARHHSARGHQRLHTSPDAATFAVSTPVGVDLFDAGTGARRRRIRRPGAALDAVLARFSPDGQRLLVAWEAQLGNVDDEVWQEHQLVVYETDRPRSVAETARSQGSLSQVMYGSVIRYETEETWMRWELGSEPAVEELEGRPVVRSDGEIAARLIESEDRGHFDIVAGVHTSRVEVWRTGLEGQAFHSPFGNGVEWRRGMVITGISAHGASHVFRSYGAARELRWTPDGRLLACARASPPPECDASTRAASHVSAGEVTVGQHDRRVLVLVRDGHEVRVEAGSDEGGTRSCLVVRDESGTVADCEPGQVLARSPGHVLTAELSESVPRGAAQRLSTFFAPP